MLSVWLAWHVFTVFMAPLSLQPKTSELALLTAQSRFVRWYTDPLYLNGGYSFFSPEPPMGGQLIRYKVFGEGREPIVEGEFPNRNNPKHATQWPRLWYHRHMMLVDQGGDLDYFANDQDNMRLTLRAYARNLLRKHEGRVAELSLVFHDSLHPEQVRSGMNPTDDQFYHEMMTVRETSDRLDQPLLPRNAEGNVIPPLPVQGGN